MKALNFPVGYHQFHTEKIINFQLNRWYSLGYARFGDLLQVAQRIKTLDDWMTWMVKITGIFTGLSVRFFKAGRIEEAWDWLETV
jgi:hypothetical protein